MKWLILFSALFAHSALALPTLVCDQFEDAKRVATVAAEKGDAASHAAGAELMQAGKCDVMDVTFPENPRSVIFQHSVKKGNFIYGVSGVTTDAGERRYAYVKIGFVKKHTIV